MTVATKRRRRSTGVELTGGGQAHVRVWAPDYRAKYFGDLRARAAAYHHGTVRAWLIGPYVDAWLKVYPEDRAGARRSPSRQPSAITRYRPPIRTRIVPC